MADQNRTNQPGSGAQGGGQSGAQRTGGQSRSESGQRDESRRQFGTDDPRGAANQEDDELEDAEEMDRSEPTGEVGSEGGSFGETQRRPSGGGGERGSGREGGRNPSSGEADRGPFVE
jgi:hypothetical protein